MLFSHTLLKKGSGIFSRKNFTVSGTGNPERPPARPDPRVLLERCLEEGPDHFPAFFRRVKPALYGPILKYRDFLSPGSVPTREETAREGFSDLFAALCRRRAADRYEAAKELVYEIWALVTEKRLLEKYSLDGRDGEGIARGLAAVAANLVYSRVTRREPEMSRLFKRLKSLLDREPEFLIFPEGEEDWWGLAGWRDPDQFSGSLEELKDHLSGIPAVFRVPERAGAGKASVVISNPDLKELAVSIYEALRKTLTDSRLIRAVGLKLPIIDAGFIPLDAPAGEEGEDDPPVPVPAGARAGPVQGWPAAAEEFVNSLTPRQRSVLRLYWMEEMTLERTGAELGLSKSLVKVEKDEVLRLLREEPGLAGKEEYECFVAALREAALEKPADRPFFEGVKKV